MALYTSLVKTLKKEWFLLGMVLAIALAALFPGPGHSGGVMHLDKITGIGIGIIFFLHGVGLSPAAIRAGLGNWRLHLLTQSTTFVLYPLLWLCFAWLFNLLLPAALALGFCYLLVLPSTISSSVAMTSVAHGNVPGAIFNASLSNIIGIFITPLLVGWFMGVAGGALDLTHTIVSIAEMLLLPMIAGQLLRPTLLGWVQRHKSLTGKVDKLVILLIIYNAFCDSVTQGIWHDFSVPMLATAIALCVIILLLVVYLLQRLTRGLGFPVEDEIAALFCGTKKTLAAGVPMAKVIFGADPRLGMLLLPIMLYHPLQIFYCAILANRYAKRPQLATA
ncbi:bile acid:sodium symporter [Shewanella sp. A32]|uniref:bile acid:sodium symporter family protein n=1 Tax=Shewanella sp. A32 TaxID=3031327 RepID=UPI0023B9EF86|nr:bile acid:sodium symporter family protein [Shewanella sp. A32]MDF0534333.1 bile acid:sodium symporter [Shewanella sp. A32]